MPRIRIHLICKKCKKEFSRDKYARIKNWDLCSFCAIQKTGSTHLQSNKKTYHVWENMKQRCLNPKHPSFKNYGGRGIKICERWIKSFENFLKDMGESPPNHFIDRIDNDGDYESRNCRWSNRKQQQNNMRSNKTYKFGELTKTLSEWCDVFNISYNTANSRLVRGWHVYMALSVPIMKKRYRKDNGQYV